MLSREEKRTLYIEFMEPGKSVETFHYVLNRFCEDFSSKRQGLLALVRLVKEKTGMDVKFDALHQHSQERNVDRDAKLNTAIPVIRTILGR